MSARLQPSISWDWSARSLAPAAALVTRIWRLPLQQRCSSAIAAPLPPQVWQWVRYGAKLDCGKTVTAGALRCTALCCAVLRCADGDWRVLIQRMLMLACPLASPLPAAAALHANCS